MLASKLTSYYTGMITQIFSDVKALLSTGASEEGRAAPPDMLFWQVSIDNNMDVQYTLAGD